MKDNKDSIIEFNQSKPFKYIQTLGSGGTGETNLFLDETMDTYFAIKKYQPSEQNKDQNEDLYRRFLDEIKILFTISHPNIVRIYNYYLYPSSSAGYIQMEYIKGTEIETYLKNNMEEFDRLLLDAINAFIFLEINNIYHRDIRPSNFMVTEEGNLKVIDFGFGKMVTGTDDENSILLNWPVESLPDEVKIGHEYNGQTEIFFLGNLFKNLASKFSVSITNSVEVLNNMTQSNPDNRYASFLEVKNGLINQNIWNTKFSEEELEIYTVFADLLEGRIASMKNEFQPIIDIDAVLKGLETLIEESIMEKFIQNNNELIKIFIENNFSFKTAKIVPVEDVRKFYQLFLNHTEKEKEIILKNITARLNSVNIVVDIDPFASDNLPF